MELPSLGGSPILDFLPRVDDCGLIRTRAVFRSLGPLGATKRCCWVYLLLCISQYVEPAVGEDSCVLSIGSSLALLELLERIRTISPPPIV